VDSQFEGVGGNGDDDDDDDENHKKGYGRTRRAKFPSCASLPC